MEIVVFLVAAILVILALIILNGFFIWKLHITDKKITELLENGEIKDFKELKNKVDQVFSTSIRKTGFVRFNPFNEMGGNQSFVIALLDGKNNGVVISSLFAKEGSRIFTKTIKNGKPDYKLSKEETEAVKMAIKS